MKLDDCKQELLKQMGDPLLTEENSVCFHIVGSGLDVHICLLRDGLFLPLWSNLHKKLALGKNHVILCTNTRSNRNLSIGDRLRDVLQDGDTLNVSIGDNPVGGARVHDNEAY